MRRNNPLTILIRRCWPASHKRYRQISVLAATGQLGGPEMSELNQHIIHCTSCRKYLESVTQASVQIMAALSDEHLSRTEIAPPAGMRARFLARVAASERNLLSEPFLRRYPAVTTTRVFVTKSSKKSLVRTQRTMLPMRAAVLPLAARAAAAVAICIAIWYAGYYGGRHRFVPRAATNSPSRVPFLTYDSEQQSSISVIQLEQRKSELEAEIREYKEKFSAATAENRIFANRLSSVTEKLALLSAEAHNQQQQAQERQDADNQISFLQSEVAKLRWYLQASEARVDEEQKQSDSLKKELEQTESELRRESDVTSAKLEIGDLVAARNLHIIDVYDADNGARQHSFGRVFYVEGKSLVFYVYDLADPRQLNANVVFRVWGEKSGTKQMTHSLGILHNEETSHDRWTLTFDDPKVLAEINSVFVTAEVANKNYSEPHGKKVLYAFFGSPSNHP